MNIVFTVGYRLLIEGTDLFEVAVLIGSCFLVNYVTADAKTNWVEGIIMMSFYLMIVSVFWAL